MSGKWVTGPFQGGLEEPYVSIWAACRGGGGGLHVCRGLPKEFPQALLRPAPRANGG